MIRDPYTIPKPIMKVMESFTDQNFCKYVCKNHISLFSDEVLEYEFLELKKYVDSIFVNFSTGKKQVDINQENEFPDLNNILVVVEKDLDYLAAIKEVLWQLKNEPSTAKKILLHIAKLNSDGTYKLISSDDYQTTNKVFSLASFNGLLSCEKVQVNNGKTVYLYKNPTDKRKGFYYKGNLLSLKKLSEINNVPVITIQTRLKKGIKLENAIQK